MKMWNFRGHSVIALGLLATGFLFAPSGNATLLAPGTSGVAIGTDTVPAGGTVVADILNNTVTTTQSGDTLTVDYSEWVYKEAGGTLDFIIQADNTGTSGQDFIDQITTSSFVGTGSTTTDVGFNSSVPGLTTISPAGIDPTNGGRSSNGAVVTFNFGSNEVMSGEKTDYLIIKTNATAFIPGTVSFQDGVTATGAGFGVAPEPGSVGLLLGGLFGVGLLVTRRFRAQQS